MYSKHKTRDVMSWTFRIIWANAHRTLYIMGLHTRSKKSAQKTCALYMHTFFCRVWAAKKMCMDYMGATCCTF